VLIGGADYTLAYADNTAIGTATVTATGTGIYTGTVAETFAIDPEDLSSATVSAIPDQAWTGSAIEPSPAIAFAGRTLARGTDYALSYSGNTAVGTATVTATGMGNYTGTASATFKIAVAISSAAIAPIADQAWTGSAITPTPSVKMGATTLVPGADYMLSYADNTAIGTATVTATGIGNYAGTASATFAIAAAAISSAAIAPIADQAWTGSALTPALSLTYNGATLVEGVDYTLAYAGNTAAGTATVAITGKGSFAGTASTAFRINPASPSPAAVQPASGPGAASGGALSQTGDACILPAAALALLLAGVACLAIVARKRGKRR